MSEELLCRLTRRLRDALHDNDMMEFDKISRRMDAIIAGLPDPGEEENDE